MISWVIKVSTFEKRPKGVVFHCQFRRIYKYLATYFYQITPQPPTIKITEISRVYLLNFRGAWHLRLPFHFELPENCFLSFIYCRTFSPLILYAIWHFQVKNIPTNRFQPTITTTGLISNKQQRRVLLLLIFFFSRTTHHLIFRILYFDSIVGGSNLSKYTS